MFVGERVWLNARMMRLHCTRPAILTCMSASGSDSLRILSITAMSEYAGGRLEIACFWKRLNDEMLTGHI
jgi:hypothetical protein